LIKIPNGDYREDCLKTIYCSVMITIQWQVNLFCQRIRATASQSHWQIEIIVLMI